MLTEKHRVSWTKSERGGEASHHLLVLLDVQGSFDDEVLLLLLLLLPRVAPWLDLRERLRRRPLLACRRLGGKRHGNLQQVGSATSCWLTSNFL